MSRTSRSKRQAKRAAERVGMDEIAKGLLANQAPEPNEPHDEPMPEELEHPEVEPEVLQPAAALPKRPFKRQKFHLKGGYTVVITADEGVCEEDIDIDFTGGRALVIVTGESHSQPRPMQTVPMARTRPERIDDPNEGPSNRDTFVSSSSLKNRADADPSVPRAPRDRSLAQQRALRIAVATLPEGQVEIDTGITLEGARAGLV